MYKNQGDPCNNTIIVLVKSIFKSVHKPIKFNKTQKTQSKKLKMSIILLD